jgi:hypothetical protein
MRLSVLPLSMMTLHTLSLVLQAVLKSLVLWTELSTSFSGVKRTFHIISDLPPSASSTSASHSVLHGDVSFSNVLLLIWTLIRLVPILSTCEACDYSTSSSSSTSSTRKSVVVGIISSLLSMLPSL